MNKFGTVVTSNGEMEEENNVVGNGFLSKSYWRVVSEALITALARWLGGVEYSPIHQKVAGLIPRRGT